jgi:hypothetical protein
VPKWREELKAVQQAFDKFNMHMTWQIEAATFISNELMRTGS